MNILIFGATGMVGLAMLGVVRRGYPRVVLEVPDIQKAAENVPAGT